MMRLGVLGGTFNPIHYGHLASANDVWDAFSLDSVIFVPAAIPPHKDLAEIIEPRHRLMMTMLATVSHPHFIVSPVEIERAGASYTVDTIAQLKQLYPQPLSIYFILGIDAFVEIASWRQPDVLLANCHTIVTSRPGHNLLGQVSNPLRRLSRIYPHLIFDPQMEVEKEPLGSPAYQVRGTPYQIFLQEVAGMDISSTDIRRRVKSGRSLRYLLPDSVDAYIRKFQLYH
jgi:nicotinate-nucleotide adenylyltransferase